MGALFLSIELPTDNRLLFINVSSADICRKGLAADRTAFTAMTSGYVSSFQRIPTIHACALASRDLDRSTA